MYVTNRCRFYLKKTSREQSIVPRMSAIVLSNEILAETCVIVSTFNVQYLKQKLLKAAIFIKNDKKLPRMDQLPRHLASDSCINIRENCYCCNLL